MHKHQKEITTHHCNYVSGQEIIEDLSQHFLDIREITKFYNKYFLTSPHNEKYKLDLYQNRLRKPIVLTIKVGENIVGLLESWAYKNDRAKRLLSTILVDNNYRNMGYAKKLFDRAHTLASQNNEENIWVLHFRDSRRNSLGSLYRSFGFEEIKLAGAYNNGQVKWEMTKRY